MVAAESNVVLSSALIHDMFSNCPSFLLLCMAMLVAYVLGERAGKVTELPAPNPWLSRVSVTAACSTHISR